MGGGGGGGRENAEFRQNVSFYVVLPDTRSRFGSQTAHLQLMKQRHATHGFFGTQCSMSTLVVGVLQTSVVVKADSIIQESMQLYCHLTVLLHDFLSD